MKITIEIECTDDGAYSRGEVGLNDLLSRFADVVRDGSEWVEDATTITDDDGKVLCTVEIL